MNETEEYRDRICETCAYSSFCSTFRFCLRSRVPWHSQKPHAPGAIQGGSVVDEHRCGDGCSGCSECRAEPDGPDERSVVDEEER